MKSRLQQARGLSPSKFLDNFISQKVFVDVVLEKSIPAQIRQRILYIGNNKGYADEFVQELTFAKRLDRHFLRDKTWERVTDRVRAKRQQL